MIYLTKKGSLCKVYPIKTAHGGGTSIAFFLSLLILFKTNIFSYQLKFLLYFIARHNIIAGDITTKILKIC